MTIAELEAKAARLTIGRLSLGREQARLSKRLLSVELVTGSVRLKGEQMKLSKGLVMSAKEVMSLVILILIIMTLCTCTSPDLCMQCMWQTIKSGQGILDIFMRMCVVVHSAQHRGISTTGAFIHQGLQLLLHLLSNCLSSQPLTTCSTMCIHMLTDCNYCD